MLAGALWGMWTRLKLEEAAGAVAMVGRVAVRHVENECGNGCQTRVRLWGT